MQFDCLGAWPGNALGRRNTSLRRRVQVEGRYKRQTNHGRHAIVEVIAEPADALSVHVDPGVLALVERDERIGALVDEAVFGMLDVLITAEPLPVLGVSIRVVRLDVHPVDSHIEDFRLAGWEAARRIVEAARG